ncbi:hypothetical protein DERF_005089 [Dermatophagoides farinae]|uniref:Uncharacterized protein n=1 Tax=Dermatophagoides farinae TaxID=6954 RepID=A0A922I560_DERFA|nr:hypothetical protein DERF_005089 [Dermatophagoides farinae]
MADDNDNTNTNTNTNTNNLAQNEFSNYKVRKIFQTSEGGKTSGRVRNNLANELMENVEKEIKSFIQCQPLS